MPRPRGRPTKYEGKRIFRLKRKAFFRAMVIRDTGKDDLREAHKRMYPYVKEVTHNNCTRDMTEEGVMEELQGFLKIRDKDIAKKVSPEAILQDLVKDIEVLNELRDGGKITTEEMVKVLNAKAGKQKLLGMAIGVWKSDKPQEREQTAGELLEALRKGGNN